MNYGKTAYLKVMELEQKIKSLDSGKDGYTSYLELSKPAINQILDNTNQIVIDFAEFKPQSKSICFQIKSSFLISSSGSVNIELLVNNIVIHSETKTLSLNENEVLTIKTFSPINDEGIKTQLRFTTSDSLKATLNSVDFIVFGANSNSANIEIELRALKLNNNRALISFIDNNKLYYLQSTIEEKSLNISDFSYLKEAISHCFCLSSYEGQDINLYRVDPSNNLYMSKLNSPTERLIASDVSVVYAETAPKSSDATNIVVYIKTDGECYYKTIKEGSEFVERKLALPQGKYTDIVAIGHEDSDYVYVLASNENGSNYIVKSIIEVSTGNIIEKLDAQYVVLTKKYIDLGTFKDKMIDSLDMTIDIILKSIFQYDELFDRLCNDYLSATATMTAKKFKIVPPINYGLYIDQAKYKDPFSWISYTDDCEGFEPAVMDATNKVFTDNGWLDRWPFSEIRPCIIKEGKVVGYLDKNNYNLFEDGTPAPITNKDDGEVMVEFPKMLYRITKEPDTENIILNISNREYPGYSKDAFVYKGKEVDKIYLSAYLCGDPYYKRNGFFSVSGSNMCAASADLTFANAYKALKGFGHHENFEFMTYPMLCTLQILYMLMFRTTKTVGYYTKNENTEDRTYENGLLNDKGMYYGSLQDSKAINKLFGLENLFGLKQQFISGFIIDKNGRIKIANPNDPELDYSPNGYSKFVELDEDYILTSDQNRVPTKINGSNYTGFFHMGPNYTDSTVERRVSFCSVNRQKKDASTFVFGYYVTGDYCGIFNMFVEPSYYFTRSINQRLMYFPIETGD